MRILHVISSGGMYGAEAVILNLSSALNRSAHLSSIAVFAPDGATGHPLHTAALAQSIPAYLLSCQGQLDLSVPAAIRSLARDTRADIIHAHGYKADLYAFFAMHRTPVPLVSTCHTWYDNDLYVRAYGALDRWFLRRYAGVVAVSNEVRDRLLRAGVAAARITLIRNGIDLTPFALAGNDRAHRPSGTPLRIGLVGRLSQEKGVDLFLRAAAGVLAQLPSATFHIVGDGPDRDALTALIRELHLQSSVTLLGHSDRMPDFYASLDLLVSASRQEGLPIALLEGMASALPLVATRVGAVPSAVSHNISGLLVPPGDVPALTAAILRLATDPDLRRSFGLAGSSRIAGEFSAGRMTEDYLALYRDVLAQSATRP